VRANTCFLDAIFLDIIVTSGYCVYKRWYSHTLANVVIVNPIHVDIISQVASSQEMVVTIIAHAKVVSYHDRHHEDDFISWVVEIFGCLHQ